MVRTGVLGVVIVVAFALAGGNAEACMPADGHRSAEVALTNGETLVPEAVTALGQEGREYRTESSDGQLPVLVYRAHDEPRAMVKLGGAQVQDGAVIWRSVLLVLPETMEGEVTGFDFAGAMLTELVWLTSIGAVTGLGPEGIEAATGRLTAGMRYFTGEREYAGVHCALPGTCYRCAGAASFTTLPAESWDTKTAVEGLETWARVKAVLSAGTYTGRCDECAGQH